MVAAAGFHPAGWSPRGGPGVRVRVFLYLNLQRNSGFGVLVVLGGLVVEVQQNSCVQPLRHRVGIGIDTSVGYRGNEAGA